MSDRSSLLIISFSDIASDARVLKQVKRFAAEYDVTTCGYGPRVDGVVEHFEIPTGMNHADLYGRFITLRMYRAAYWRMEAMRWVRGKLGVGLYDVILANELEAMPVALALKPLRGIHLDLHEYTPLLNEEYPAWKRRIKPYHEWMCRRFATKADSWSTVSEGLAREYKKNFGFSPDLVTNAAPFVELEPTPVSKPIRLVHSGACLRNRQLMTMLDAVALSTNKVTFDLYLTPNDPGYLDELKQRASEIQGITVRDAVPYRELIATLNDYDVGVHLLAPTNFNNTWALPNKLFDYVQARLAVLIGPTAEMAAYVTKYGIGIVADEFTASALALKIDGLNPESVSEFESSAHRHAHELSAESQLEIWASEIAALFERKSRTA
jgi:hypothetical protein